MKVFLLIAVLSLALQASGCPDAEAAKPAANDAPFAPDTGREAMRVDGKRVGVLERQKDGTYLLRYSDKEAERVSINEVILMPKGER